MEGRSSRRRGIGPIAVGAIMTLGGCQSLSEWTSSSVPVTADQFNRASAPEELVSRTRVPPAIYEPPTVVVEETAEVEPSGEGIIETRAAATTTMPAGEKVTIPMGPEDAVAILPQGRPWPVDALVGQINGKAIYADDFLKGMADRLIQLGRATDRVAARRELIRQVSERFDQEVNNRLIISEAESSIPPEAREGLFQWLRQLQEQEIASRGGTRSAASASLQDQFDMSVEQFLERRKNEALANDLLRKRIEPRAIVTWRDIERAYEKARDQYNPGATITLGRIALLTADDGAKIDEVKAQFASGATFTEVAQRLGLANDGEWIKQQLGEKGIDGLTDLRVEVRNALKGLSVGEVSEAFTLGSTTVWVSVLGTDQPEARSLFDPDVQLRLRAELQNQRRFQEQSKYFEALRSRWISDDIDQMRIRLVDIALQRYME